MLGENHSLFNEFPEYKKTIIKLCHEDRSFAKDAGKYDSLDNEIRELELDSVPISDDSMHQLKHERAVLKDSLYKRILK